MSAPTWFGSVLAAAVGGAPDDACRMLARAEPAMPASLCDHCADVSDLLSWSSSRVQLHRLCSSSEQGTCVRCAQHTHKLFHLSGAGECHPSFMEATGGSAKMFMDANELTQRQHRNTQREPKKHRPRQTDRQTYRQTDTDTYTNTHRPVRQECDMLGTSWCSHNERGTVATHTQVPTGRKQMRLHVGSPLV